MPTPKIDMNLPVAKNIKIIYGDDHNLNNKAEAEMAEAFLKLVKPKQNGDELRIFGLRQSLSNYYEVGESAYLLHCTKVAYHYLADKGGKLYADIRNYFSKNPEKLLTQNK